MSETNAATAAARSKEKTMPAEGQRLCGCGARHDVHTDQEPAAPGPLATHIVCIECDDIYELDELLTADEAEDEYCPEDGGHAVHGVHATSEPLGIDGVEDRDYYHHGRRRYEYDLRDLP